MAPSRRETCLNGLWDFLPVLAEEGRKHAPPGGIPQEGWLPGAIMVPGSWTRGGYVPTAEDVAAKPWSVWGNYDSYGYPAEWDAAGTAWYRRSFTVDEIDGGRRWSLFFGGILREAWVFVNGTEVGRTTDGIMPSEHDVTDALRAGENELVVYVTDYRRDEEGKTFVPTGADQMKSQMGIWRDVYLVNRPDVHVDNVTIRTSVRRGTRSSTSSKRACSKAAGKSTSTASASASARCGSTGIA